MYGLSTVELLSRYGLGTLELLSRYGLGTLELRPRNVSVFPLVASKVLFALLSVQ